MFRMASGADTFVAGTVAFASLVTVPPNLAPRLALKRLAEARVHVRGSRTAERVVGMGVGTFLAVATQDVVVVRLRRNRVYGVRLIRVLLGRCARRHCLCMELGNFVGGFGLDSELMLLEEKEIRNPFIYYLQDYVHTFGAPLAW